MLSVECVARTWSIAVLRWGALTSRVSFQRTHQLGAFRQAITLFFPALLRLVAGAMAGSGRTRWVRGTMRNEMVPHRPICRKRTCFLALIYLARIHVGLTTAKRIWEGAATKFRYEDCPNRSPLRKRAAAALWRH